MVFASLALAAALLQSGPGTRPTYEQAQRCSALVQVASLADAEDDDLFDAGLYWALAAAEIARDADVTDRDFASAQARARADAGTALQPGGDGQGSLDACLKAVPSLDGQR